ncbi:MAG TPA: 3-phosphoshikimate 1-carboxyvinyltransferase [Sphingomicrobium sp.]|nr:3-phosphoshikimate 1-carboxyvinyltransferase [Sphingomicrobium sp.]
MLTARRSGPLAGEARVPGDKSCSHRALILGAMAQGETEIEGLGESADVLATVDALRAFGRPVERIGAGRWRIAGGNWQSPDEPIDCGNSATTARLLVGAVAGMAGVTATFTGDPSLCARPMLRLVEPLRRMGADIDGVDRLPLTVRGVRLSGIEHDNEPPSAQVKAALLLAGLAAAAPVTIRERMPSRDHSEIMLREFGGPPLRGTTVRIGGDPSSAAFPLVAAAIVPGSDVRLSGMLANPLRLGLIRVLERMGADLALSNERRQSGEVIADIRVRHAPLTCCRVAAGEVPALIDEVPALAVACAFADGQSVIEGLGELRVKESDRLAGIASGLEACGVEARVVGDDLHIVGRGSVPGGASVSTGGDHRIAMAFLTLGLASEQPVSVDRDEMIATSFRGFVDTMRALGGDIR